MNETMNDDDLPKWKRRKGDRYVTAVGHIIGNPTAGYETVYDHEGIHDTFAAAKLAGFRSAESDDFNIGVIRDGRLIAWCWMDEVVDDGPDELARLAEALGISA